MKNTVTASRIKLALSNAGISARELSKRSGVGEASISQYTNGSHAPSNITSSKMAKVLCVNPLWLMGFDTPMEVAKEESSYINVPEVTKTDKVIAEIVSELETKSDDDKLLVLQFVKRLPDKK